MTQTYCTVVGALVKNLSEIEDETLRRLVMLVTMACDKGTDNAGRNEEVFFLVVLV